MTTGAADLDFRWTVIRADRMGLKKLRTLVDKEDVRVLRSPATGLVMMAVEDSSNTQFYLGEVLVTEAELEFEGRRGYGIVVGEDPDRAYTLAALDAMLQSGDSLMKKKIRSELLSQQRRVERIMKKEESLIAGTKVNFESMAAL
jgi:alpha-D-ribose 1-methylphosphonate 5-triphosphate synthase subunit PhnG